MPCTMISLTPLPAVSGRFLCVFTASHEKQAEMVWQAAHGVSLSLGPARLSVMIAYD